MAITIPTNVDATLIVEIGGTKLKGIKNSEIMSMPSTSVG